MNEPIIEIRNVTFSYNGNIALKDVSFCIMRKDFLALIGPNGGGKTTLLKLTMGLLDPNQGEIRVFGLGPCKVSERMGYVPQHMHSNIRFPISVRDVVLMGRMRAGRWWSGYTREDRRAAKFALERLEMWQYRNRRIGELSGGQRQRVFIARALVTEPEILLLDEATAGIDAKGQRDFYDILYDLNQTVTIIMASHDLMFLSSHVKSIACVNQRVYYHDDAEITEEMVDMCNCPVELIAHGLPHRVLRTHEDR